MTKYPDMDLRNKNNRAVGRKPISAPQGNNPLGGTAVIISGGGGGITLRAESLHRGLPGFQILAAAWTLNPKTRNPKSETCRA